MQMIWKILQAKELQIPLPANFNWDTMYQLIDKAVDENADSRCTRINFDFERLQWIEPVGIVVLSNLFEYLTRSGVKVSLSNFKRDVVPIRFLDDSGFFAKYLKSSVFPNAKVRSTTIPLQFVKSEGRYEYLSFKLLPWIGERVHLKPESLDALRVSIEEILLNIDHHSQVGIGCAFAQFYPQKQLIKFAISDFGVGIPNTVRKKLPELDDKAAIRKACEEGFSTQSNVRNRGAGIPNLMRYVTVRNKGTVLIASGKGAVSASENDGSTKITARTSQGFYPGTLVQVILRTDTFDRITEDVEQEVFSW